jgi:hypothetical protein
MPPTGRIPLSPASGVQTSATGRFSRLASCATGEAAGAAEVTAATQRVGRCGGTHPTLPLPRTRNPAAGVGFEPTGDLSAASGFQDRPVRPLRHPAVPHCRRLGRALPAKAQVGRGFARRRGLTGEPSGSPVKKTAPLDRSGTLPYLIVAAHVGRGASIRERDSRLLDRAAAVQAERRRAGGRRLVSPACGHARRRSSPGHRRVPARAPTRCSLAVPLQPGRSSRDHVSRDGRPAHRVLRAA